MIKRFLNSAILLMATCLGGGFVLGSCSSDEESDDIWLTDWNPVEISIKVNDAQGNNLLDSTDVAHYIADGATATFMGKTYDLGSLTEKENTNKSGLKVYMPKWDGFRIEMYPDFNTKDGYEYMLVFGEIDGARDMHENLTITWKDGSKDVITYHCSDHNNEKMTCNRWFSVNGEITTNRQITIVK